MIGEKPVRVTGASGFVGSHITRLLCKRGRSVRVLPRESSKREALADLPGEITVGDVLDPASLRRAMNCCGTLFYSVVDPRFWLTDQTSIFRNNVEGLINAMDVALECGIKRFIVTSSMGTLGLDPDCPFQRMFRSTGWSRAPPYIRVRLAAENQFLAYRRDEGLPSVALCVANIASGKAKVAVDVGQPTVDIRDVAEPRLLRKATAGWGNATSSPTSSSAPANSAYSPRSIVGRRWLG